jgi:hypothetical protein
MLGKSTLKNNVLGWFGQTQHPDEGEWKFDDERRKLVWTCGRCGAHFWVEQWTRDLVWDKKWCVGIGEGEDD